MIEFRVMQEDDEDFFFKLVRQVGWNLTDADFQRILSYSPEGCFIASVNGDDVGTIVTTIYGDVAWIGNVIVPPGLRGKGIGAGMMLHAMNYLQENNVTAIRLDSVPRAISLYRRLGFKDEYRSLRHTGIAARRRSEAEPMTHRSLPEVLRMDRRVFNANRGKLIRRNFKLYPGLCFTVHGEGALLGFIMARDAGDVVNVGPWICTPGHSEEAETLLHAVMNQRIGRKVWVGTPEGNTAAVKIFKQNGFTAGPSSLRMCYGRCGRTEKVEAVYGIGGPDKG